MMTVCQRLDAGPAAAQWVPLSATQSSWPLLRPRSRHDLHAHSQNRGPGQPSPLRTRGDGRRAGDGERRVLVIEGGLELCSWFGQLGACSFCE